MAQQKQIRIDAISRLVGGELIGDGTLIITSADDIRDAQPGGIVFAEAPKYLEAAYSGGCSAVITRLEFASALQNPGKPTLFVANPRAAFATVLEQLVTPWIVPIGVHPTAVIEDGVQLGAEVRIGAHVWIESGVVVADSVTVMSGARIGAECSIGAGTVLYPNVVLYPGVKIGRRCLLHAGCVLGADGFGYVPMPNGLLKVPHVGTVEVGDGVEIGANTCIDRAKTGTTSIGAGTKIDNLVHVAHNVKIGQSCFLVAQTGLAGSVQIGNGVILAGQSGVADHITIGDGATVGAQGGVIGDVAARERVSGYPARPHAKKMREYAAVAALPEYLKRIRALEKRIGLLEGALNERQQSVESGGSGSNVSGSNLSGSNLSGSEVEGVGS